MDIKLHNVAKRYRFEWIFRNISYEFESGRRYAIAGPNGAGKSTFLKILSGHLSPTEGKVVFFKNGASLEPDIVYKYLGFAAPYIDLIEELTLMEAIVFHKKFKTFRNELQPDDLIRLLQFSKADQKEIRYFSSGMKQRLKLVLAVCSDTELLLLDEPTTNLDVQGMNWYHDLIGQFADNRTLIIASNDHSDFDFCQTMIDIRDFKTG